jgi:hypothetical protein
MAKNTNNNSKTTKTVEPVIKTPTKNDNSKKKGTSTTNTKSADSFPNDLSKQVGTKMTTAQTVTTKTTGTGSGQTGKKRGSYSQNLWAIEFREGGEGSDKYLADPNEVYVTRDEARDALADVRKGYFGPLKRGDARLAKYTFTRVDQS